MSRVLVREATYNDCRQAVDKAFEAFPVDVKGKRVVVKMNALMTCDPDKEAHVTHYKLVEAIIQKLETMEPAQILCGDAVGTVEYGSSERVFEAIGFKRVAGKYYKNFNKNLIVHEFKEPIQRKLALLKDVLDADVYISVPKMKTHGMTMLSGAVKNNYGLVTGAQKSLLHYITKDPDIFVRLLLELYKLKKPDLVIMDAVLAMEGYGPASKEVHWVNKILASNDGLAMEAVQAQIMGINPEDVPTLRLAKGMGLGETEIEKIEVLGDASPIPDYKTPQEKPESTFSYRAGVGTGKTSIDFFRQRVAFRPVIEYESCHPDCRECVITCPAGALSWKNNKPELDKMKCMVCSACKEACRHDALKLVVDDEVYQRLIVEER